MTVALKKIVSALDAELHTSEIKDYDRAFNGLQIENSGSVTRVVAAVDSHIGVIEQAVRAKADLLIVHHGLLWNPPLPATGAAYRKLKLCFDHNLAVYSSHLPLDFHPRMGNDALLAKALGLKKQNLFRHPNGKTIALCGELSLDLKALTVLLEKILAGPVLAIQGHDRPIKKIAVMTGGAGTAIEDIAASGADTFITGEGPHHTFGLAKELGINLLYGGHYATETFGVKALGAWVSKKFHIPWSFLDHPSGL